MPIEGHILVGVGVQSHPHGVSMRVGFLVQTFRERSAMVKWWREKGADMFSYPGVKSLRAYAAQFGLAGRYDLEVWLELENYGALDKMDEWFVENPDLAKKKQGLWKESDAYFEWGPARLMGDFPESSLLPK